MDKVAKYWPTIRQVTYAVLAAGLAVAAGAGWITQDSADLWLTHAVTALGAVGFIVAGLFVDRTSKAQDAKIEDAVRSGVELATAAVTPMVQDAVKDIPVYVDSAQQYLDQVRAETEQRLRSLGR